MGRRLAIALAVCVCVSPLMAQTAQPPLRIGRITIDAMPLWAWGAFFLFITAMLALDLGIFQRESHAVV